MSARLGDYEQNDPALYDIANYPELYILGSFGQGRKQVQVINQYDPSCFGGIKWQTYKDAVRQHVEHLGAGEYDLFLDDSEREHTITYITVDHILDVFAARGDRQVRLQTVTPVEPLK